MFLAIGLVLLAPVTRAGAAEAGSTQTYTWGSGDQSREFIVYTPSGYKPSRPMPLVVLAHGCMTTADQMMRASLFNEEAERKGFIVMYPDVDQAQADLPQPLKRCWRFYEESSWHRDQGDAAAIAGMTRETMRLRAVDRQRVYMSGASAGGFMTSILTAAYPDLYAAVAIAAAGQYEDTACVAAMPGLMPPSTSAQLAFEEMGDRARIVPRMVIGGDADQGIVPACADKALEQGLRTDNLVLGSSQESPISLAPAMSREVPKAGGYPTTVSTYLDPAGCVIGERWMIHGMNHFWPGGSTDPELANFTDPKGPNGAEAVWQFLQRYTRDETAMPCAETPICRRHFIFVRVAKNVNRAVATVDGERAPTRLRRGWLRIKVPVTRRARTAIGLKLRAKGGRKVERRATFKGCGPAR
ncbi:MAG: prolyl oligopeptidase family serine peptidase [Solirubrobacterales bacterium]|nr:prolyl oligopeptidase family serine peptidase [Solirubrobacterales bacterium]